MKKLLSVLLSIALVFSFATVAAFAEETKGTIYINNANSETSYSAYKLFDLASMAEDGSSYSYKIGDENPWYAFISAQTNYFTLDEIETVDGETFYSVTKTDAYTESSAIDFAKDALSYAKDPANVAVSATATILGSVGKFTNLELGYYLIDSTVGSLCGLTTTKPEASITAKNLAPTIDKNVQEDSIAASSTNSWGKYNTADIGQLNKFDVTIYAQAGAENYVYHDNMENMILYNPESTSADYAEYGFKVTYNGAVLEEGDDGAYKLTVVPDAVNGDSFEVAFSKEFCDLLKANDKVYITYSGKLNQYANIGSTGNKNTGYLTYGSATPNPHKTANSETVTYTYGFDVVKTDHNYNPLSGAKFELYTLDSEEHKVLVPLAYNSTTNTYRKYNAINTALEEEKDIIEVKVNSNAHDFTIARINGLDNGTYYLREIEAPAGYNKLTTDREFIISGSEIYASFTESNDAYTYDRGSGIHVENKAGATMPETGGTGTMMFIVIGTITVLGAGILLVTKKRMSMIED